MATNETKLNLTLPEPWLILMELAGWLEEIADRTKERDPALAKIETRDALKIAVRDLLDVIKFYRTDREHPSGMDHELVPRYTVMILHEDGTTTSHGVFVTEQEAEATTTHVVKEQHDVKHVWVRRMLVSVVYKEAKEALEHFLTEIGLTEDELADAIAHHPA